MHDMQKHRGPSRKQLATWLIVAWKDADVKQMYASHASICLALVAEPASCHRPLSFCLKTAFKKFLLAIQCYFLEYEQEK